MGRVIKLYFFNARSGAVPDVVLWKKTRSVSADIERFLLNIFNSMISSSNGQVWSRERGNHSLLDLDLGFHTTLDE